MTAFLVPLVPSPQKFTTTLAGVVYTVTLHWCVPASCWVLDLADVNEVPIRSGIPLVTGCDLMEQFAYLDLGGALVVQTSSNPDAVPNLTNLGTDGNLFFVTPPGADA